MLCMMATAGVGAAGSAPCSFSGTLTLIGAPSGGIVTGPTVTVTVPGGNSGTLTFSTFVMGGTVTLQYSKNGGAFTTITDPTDVTSFTNGETLAMRITGAIATESMVFTVTDKTTGAPIGTYRLEAT